MEVQQFTEKRKRYFWSHITDVFIGRQSRKVAFGVWGFIAANALITDGKIDMLVYWKMFLTCALLIGFGTILDSILEKLGDQLAARVADKIKPEVSHADPAAPQVPVQ